MTYDDHRAALIQYLKAKVDICDWHAVRDACVDIEILEAREAARGVIKTSWNNCSIVSSGGEVQS